MSQPLYHDLSGDRLTVANDPARLAWNDTLEAVMAHAAATPEHLARTLAADPDFALAHAAKGLMLLSLARAELVGAARECLLQARASAGLRPVTRREAMVIEALSLWLDDAPRRAAERLEAILPAHPHDVLALKLSHGLRFMLGDQQEMLATLQRFAPGFGEHHPLAGYVNGCHAFALEERGFYAEAERTGRRAVALSPRDAWGRHAVAHVLEMTGRAGEGIAWLGEGRGIAHANNLRFHIFWHLALFRLERGENAEVLRLYDEEIRAEPTDDYRDIADLIGHSEANCRQLVHRARQRLQAGRPRFNADASQHRQLLARFMDASQRGDSEAIQALLHANALLVSDGGGVVTAAVRPLLGAERIGRLFWAIARRGASYPARLGYVNGEPAILRFQGDHLHSVTTIEVVDGHIANIYSVLNPEKLPAVVTRGDSVASW